MDTKAVADAFTTLCRNGQFDAAGKQFWAPGIVSIEAMDGPMARLEGIDAVEMKAAWWYTNHEIHDVKVAGPYLNGNQFALRFSMDFTPKGGERTQSEEVAVYTVADGKVVEERFFY